MLLLILKGQTMKRNTPTDQNTEEMVKYFCKNPDCKDLAYAKSMDEILERGKLCPRCIRNQSQSKRILAPDHKTLAKVMSENRGKRIVVPKHIYVCKQCHRRTIPMSTAPRHCDDSKCPCTVFVKLTGVSSTSTVVLHALSDKHIDMYFADIMFTLKDILDTTPELVGITDPSMLSTFTYAKFQNYIEYSGMTNDNILADLRLLLLAINLISDVSQIDSFWHNMETYKIDKIQSILAVLPETFKIIIKETM